MNKLPGLKSRQLLRALEKAGFRAVRQKGSHVFMLHADGRTTVVPDHPGKQTGKGLLSAILKEVKLSPEELRRLL